MNWQEFEQKFPIQLNNQQREAVQSMDGPVLLLAVPGSGKTTVLVTRLGYMVYCKGIDPNKILTVTYTVAATKDMAKRFASYFGNEMADKLEFRTINGICAKIIQYYGKLVGRTAFDLVKDEKMTSGMLSKIYQQTQHEFATESDLKNVRTLITYIKNMMLNEEEILQLDEEAEIKISVIYREYCRQLKIQHLMDYDDQMVYAYTMLRRFPQLLEYFQNLYPYICVDEAQDTSKIQHAIIALLASKTENLFMVGDEDQSIYGFRAAYPEALLSFEKNHPHAKVLLMEDNFRSNANIVVAADKFIQKNTLRHEKHMRATKDKAEEIKEVSFKSRKAQYSYLVKVADGCTTQTAVLYRDNECALPLIDLLERNEIPYQMRNAELTFFTHRTVLDIVNIIKLAINPNDTEAFLQVYYKIGTYLRKQDAIRIAEISEKKKLPVLDVAVDYHGLSGHVIGSVKSVRTHLQNMLQDSGEKAVKRIADFMGYREYLNRIGISDSKLEILRMLGAKEESPEHLVKRLEELKKIIQEKQSDPQCPFILSTMHASKGLEYDQVYLIDVVDGILPEQVPKSLKYTSKEELQTYEEERRLFYVGVTRAKQKLTLFTTNRPSTFCSELLGQETKPINKPKEPSINKVFTQTHLYAQTAQPKVKPVTAEAYEKFKEQLGSGVIVEHKKFGEGVVVSMDEERVQILFGEKMRNLDMRMLVQGGFMEVKE